MAIDPKLPIPVYFQLKTLLLEEILEGRYGLDIRHRRRGTFVNPHWVHRNRGGPELRVIVPEGPGKG
jgi:hypothetical protein